MSTLRAYEKPGTFSERFPILFNQDNRLQKAEKVIRIISEFSRKDLKSLNCLDVGASTCLMTAYFARFFGSTIAVDNDWVGLESAQKLAEEVNLLRLCGDGEVLPLKDESVDVVICNHVYEHVLDPRKMVAEIYRVLKPDGFCFFGAGNRFVVIEGHYFLPFLSWFPNKISTLYLRMMGRKIDYDVFLYSYFKLKRLLRRFKIIDYTLPVLKDPAKFAATDLVRAGSPVTKVPGWVFKSMYPLLPSYLWILVKK